MGCCFSTRDHRPEPEHRRCSSSPPAAPEEETVKEVLLETPLAIPRVDGRIKELTPQVNPGRKAEVGPPPAAVIPSNGGDSPPKAHEEIIPEVSEVSELCSLSQSFSNNATAQGKKDEDDDDDDGVVNQKPPVRKRRPPTGGRGRGVARRAAAPLPEKRGQVAPLRPVRRRSTAAQPRNAVEENERRRDLGDDSGRRPSSPVRGGEVGGRRNVNDEKRPPTAEPTNDVVSTEEAETLENPVVSLECFIFL